jgi:hypothetical protein
MRHSEGPFQIFTGGCRFVKNNFLGFGMVCNIFLKTCIQLERSCVGQDNEVEASAIIEP